MHRLFLDANVLFSAAYGPSTLSRLWSLARQGELVLVTSAYALEEARRNLDDEAQSHLDEIAREIVLVPEVEIITPSPFQLPPKDRPILAAALNARATHLLTGDRRHFGPYFSQSVEGMMICTPREYFAQRQRDEDCICNGRMGDEDQ